MPVLKQSLGRGAWVAQSVERPASAQVMISRFVSSSPASGSVLPAQSLGACFGSCVSLSLCPSPTHALSLSLSRSPAKINKNIKKKKKSKLWGVSWISTQAPEPHKSCVTLGELLHLSEPRTRGRSSHAPEKYRRKSELGESLHTNCLVRSC